MIMLRLQYIQQVIFCNGKKKVSERCVFIFSTPFVPDPKKDILQSILRQLCRMQIMITQHINSPPILFVQVCKRKLTIMFLHLFY